MVEIIRRRLALIRRRIWLVLVEVWRAVVNHRPLRRRILNGRLRIWILDGIQRGIKAVRLDDNMASSDFAHRILGGILALDLLPFGLLGLRPVSLEYAIAEPLLLGSLQGRQEHRTVETEKKSVPVKHLPVGHLSDVAPLRDRVILL